MNHLSASKRQREKYSRTRETRMTDDTSGVQTVYITIIPFAIVGYEVIK